jgi:hypothetical protein
MKQSTAEHTFYSDVYTIHVITQDGNGRTFKAGCLDFADTIAKRFPVAVVLCNGVQLCVWANGIIVQGSPDARIDASSADYMRERALHLSMESDWNGAE